ncbi:MAG TPA: hypothetical protein VFB82_12270 [Blastocatellia bacterium]|jgi:hypothetical protein|nr:hypothetical protein [Blastocatellia bacterium]
MQQEITDSNMLDLFEEMLFARAVKGIRPLLYVSSNRDFECSVQKLLDEPRESRVWEEHRFTMPELAQRATNCF